MNPWCARVCETETDAQVQEKEVHDAAVLAGLIPVSQGPGVPERASALLLESPLHSRLTLVFREDIALSGVWNLVLASVANTP